VWDIVHDDYESTPPIVNELVYFVQNKPKQTKTMAVRICIYGIDTFLIAKELLYRTVLTKIQYIICGKSYEIKAQYGRHQ